MKLKMPSWLAIALGILAGLVGGFNVATFNLGQPWSELVTFGCAAIAALGVAPLAHEKLRNALHLGYPAALTLAGFMTTATAAVTATNWSASLKGVVVGILTSAAGMLAGPDSPTGAVLPPAPEPVPAPVAKTPAKRQAKPKVVPPPPPRPPKS